MKKQSEDWNPVCLKEGAGENELVSGISDLRKASNANKHGRSDFGKSNRSPDLSGRRFGMLTVLRASNQRGPRGSRTTPMWECLCDCGEIAYRATDTLKNSDCNMCRTCAQSFATRKARANAGFQDGTQLSKIRSTKLTVLNTSGVRGVSWDKRTCRWRVRLKFQGKQMSFGSYRRLEDAAIARKKAEQQIFGAYLEGLGNNSERG